jgi:hypothetical protein
MNMQKKERSELIHRLADEMARSGDYKDWGSIERALRAQGYLEARQLLDSQFRRQELDEMCNQANVNGDC